MEGLAEAGAEARVVQLVFIAGCRFCAAAMPAAGQAMLGDRIPATLQSPSLLFPEFTCLSFLLCARPLC